MPTSLLVLANSYKFGGRCLAGVNEADEWVRPVADESGAELLPAILDVGGRSVEPGDVINVELGQHVPLFYQSENKVLEHVPVSYGPAPSSVALQARLESIASKVPQFALSPRTSIDASEYGTLAPDSLALLHTKSLNVVWRQNFRGDLRPRAIFMTSQGGWDVPYTGEQSANFPARASGERGDLGEAFVTVSVGEGLDGGPSHFVLAAGFIPVN